MSDLISRQAAIDGLKKIPDLTVYAYCSFLDMLMNMPSVQLESTIGQLNTDAQSTDVVEVVRCKDCKWFNDIGCSIRIVDDSDKPTENDYCSFGERKDGNV